MTTLTRRLTALVLVAVLALSATAALAAELSPTGAPLAAPAQDHGDEGEGTPATETDTSGLVSRSWWAVGGVLVGAVVMGVFYLFKRRVGGFPANPDWVAPITIMPSKDFPSQGDYGDVDPAAHGAHQ
jgi:hypothetical protein